MKSSKVIQQVRNRIIHCNPVRLDADVPVVKPGERAGEQAVKPLSQFVPVRGYLSLTTERPASSNIRTVPGAHTFISELVQQVTNGNPSRLDVHLTKVTDQVYKPLAKASVAIGRVGAAYAAASPSVTMEELVARTKQRMESAMEVDAAAATAAAASSKARRFTKKPAADRTYAQVLAEVCGEAAAQLRAEYDAVREPLQAGDLLLVDQRMIFDNTELNMSGFVQAFLPLSYMPAVECNQARMGQILECRNKGTHTADCGSKRHDLEVVTYRPVPLQSTSENQLYAQAGYDEQSGDVNLNALTPQQIAFFVRYGFVVVPGVVSADVCSSVLANIDEAVSQFSRGSNEKRGIDPKAWRQTLSAKKWNRISDNSGYLAFQWLAAFEQVRLNAAVRDAFASLLNRTYAPGSHALFSYAQSFNAAALWVNPDRVIYRLPQLWIADLQYREQKSVIDQVRIKAERAAIQKRGDAMPTTSQLKQLLATEQQEQPSGPVLSKKEKKAKAALDAALEAAEAARNKLKLSAEQLAIVKATYVRRILETPELANELSKLTGRVIGGWKIGATATSDARNDDEEAEPALWLIEAFRQKFGVAVPHDKYPVAVSMSRKDKKHTTALPAGIEWPTVAETAHLLEGEGASGANTVLYVGESRAGFKASIFARKSQDSVMIKVLGATDVDTKSKDKKKDSKSKKAGKTDKTGKSKGDGKTSKKVKKSSAADESVIAAAPAAVEVSATESVAMEVSA